MSFIDRISATQTRRIVFALILSVAISAVAGVFFVSILSRAHAQATQNIIIYRLEAKAIRGVIFLFLMLFLSFHLVLYNRFKSKQPRSKSHFSLAQAMLCILVASIILGMNFIPIQSPPFTTSNSLKLLGIHQETQYGFPYIIQEKHFDWVLSETRPETSTLYSIPNMVKNGLVLLLFIPNLLAIKFPSRNPDSLSQRAANDASH